MCKADFAYPKRAGDVTPGMLAMPTERLVKLARHPLQVFPTKEALYQHIARFMADMIRDNNRAGKPTRWIIPIGPKAQYPILAKITNDEKLSWKNVWMFHMDEW